VKPHQNLAPIDYPLTTSVIEELLPGERAPHHVQLLLNLAGYKTDEGWLTRTNLDRTRYLLNDPFTKSANEFGILPEGCEVEVLRQLNINPEFYQIVIASLTKISKRSGRYVTWKESVVDKAVAILALRGKPTSMDVIISEIGESYSIAGARDRLRADPRVVRVNKTEFGLRAWGLEEYSGITEEITERIKRGGGVADLESVVTELVTTFDVAEISVRTYCSAPMFVIEEGMIRLRSFDEHLKVSEDLTRVKGVYRINSQRISMLFSVDKDTLRGSGRPLVPALTAALRAQPGQECTYQGRDGSIRVTWPMTGALGGSRGSIRDLILSLGAREGDRVLLIFDTEQMTVEYSLIDENVIQEGPSLGAVAELTGIHAENAAEAARKLATAIGVDQTSLRKTLFDRGDLEVVSVLPEKVSTDDMAQALAELADVLGKE